MTYLYAARHDPGSGIEPLTLAELRAHAIACARYETLVRGTATAWEARFETAYPWSTRVEHEFVVVRGEAPPATFGEWRAL